MTYIEKYLKYKSKYLNLTNKLVGGEKTTIFVYAFINNGPVNSIEFHISDKLDNTMKDKKKLIKNNIWYLYTQQQNSVNYGNSGINSQYILMIKLNITITKYINNSIFKNEIHPLLIKEPQPILDEKLHDNINIYIIVFILLILSFDKEMINYESITKTHINKLKEKLKKKQYKISYKENINDPSFSFNVELFNQYDFKSKQNGFSHVEHKSLIKLLNFITKYCYSPTYIEDKINQSVQEALEKKLKEDSEKKSEENSEENSEKNSEEN